MIQCIGCPSSNTHTRTCALPLPLSLPSSSPTPTPRRFLLDHSHRRLFTTPGNRQRDQDLLDALHHQQRWGDIRRLSGLRDPSVSHEWLWALNPCHGPTVPRHEFLTAVRLRLGAPSVDEPIVCSRCSKILDRSCCHALLRATPEATRGHYDVRDAVLALAHLADPGAETESIGLIPTAPALRPADILTSAAIPGRLAALDIGVTSPDAAGAGEDCCDAMWQTKVGKYEDYASELNAQGIRYQPMVFSHMDGPTLTRMLSSTRWLSERHVATG